MAAEDFTRLPFAKAIDFFQSKVPLPSGAHTDLVHAMHDRAFVIAGVTRQDVLTEVQGLVEKAMKEGTPLKAFQTQFERAIQGKWVPRNQAGVENAAWRARVIYETNIRTAYAAGRWQQLHDLKKTHPFWVYRHGDSRRPRLQHLNWDRLTLKADDPWWQTHYPPNGWGCRCYVDAADEIDLEDMGKSGPDPSPKDGLQTVKFGGREIQVPAGVDPGWGYAPGGNGNQGLLRALANGNPPMAAQAWTQIGQVAVKAEAPAFRSWAQDVLTAKRGGNVSRVVGFLDSELLAKVETRGLSPASAAIEILDKDLLHLSRDTKAEAGKVIPTDSLMALPEILAKPKAVLYDRRKLNLIYVFDTDRDHRNGKFAVEVGMVTKLLDQGQRVSRSLNRIRTAGLVERHVLTDTNTYDLLLGGL